ncbi:phosphotransferase [Paenibacillus sp. 102]|uniref:aminoglycoside phosphotransferase family protein n=1 Tax=Paenibacillus sp. 102 TaxID=3120823 RepID=UPI0031BA59A2
MSYLINDIIDELPCLNGYSSIRKIEKGYSLDSKYIVNVGNNNYFLRVSDTKQTDKKELEFTLLKELDTLHVQTHKPIEYRVLKDKGLSLMVMSYIEGTPANEVIAYISDETQYKIGLAAGKELRKIHQFKAPKYMNWEEVQKKKFNFYLNEYKRDNFQLQKEDKLITFIEDNISLLKNRSVTLLHDDFHLGHIIVLHDNYNGVIDFNGYDFGDPYHDFYNLSLFSRRQSIPFCIGQIQGYFRYEPDETFWRLYALYAAMNIFSTIVWTRKYDPASFNDALERIDLIVRDHDFFNSNKPIWYNSFK